VRGIAGTTRKVIIAVSTTIRRFATAEEISRAAVAQVIERAQTAIAARGRFTIALSGGSTPKRLYQLLAEPALRGQIDWPKVECFWGDERSVPPDHPDSNFHMAHEALLTQVALTPEHIHRMEAERADRDAAADAYQAMIAQVFGSSQAPVFDLILHGMGPDGHTLSLFPNTQALQEAQRWVVPNYVPKFKTWRMTMTPVLVNQAAYCLFLVAGADKAQALVEVLEGPRDPANLPSQLIRPTHGELIWFVDDAAAARLQKV
jgi:6-phosphogluconolactonase